MNIFIAAMVQGVIPMSGPPNLAADPAYTNGNAKYTVDALCAESDIACPPGLDLNGKIAHLRSLTSVGPSTKIFYWFEAGSSIGAMTSDPHFWGSYSHPLDAARDGTMKPANMLIGFTSYEGSLQEATIPSTYNVNNIISEYGGLDGRWNYGECVNYDFDLKNLLVTRLYQRMSCEYGFPVYQEDMTDEHAQKIAFEIYGDSKFRSPSVRHAKNYLNIGAKVWVYNFDTDEHTTGNQMMHGAAHASELKYFFGWGNDHRPWQQDVKDFLLTSWRNFIINGDPSSSKYPWSQYDDFEGIVL